MFELIFGIFWTAISAFFAFVMFAGDGGVTVNGQFVEQAEFNAMLWPKIFIGVFIAIGIFMIVLGLRKILRNMATATKGDEVYGVVLDVYPSGSRVNGRPILNADVVIVDASGSIGRYTESIGMGYKYMHGDFVRVKHYKNDVNILDKVEGNTVPYHIKSKLDTYVGMNYANNYGYGGEQERYDDVVETDTVIVNGIEYVRKK